MTMARELIITYAGYAASPDGQHHWSDSFDSFSLDFSFLVKGTSASDLATKLAAARAAYRTPFGDLTVALGASTLISLKPSDGTGLETKPTITKEEGDPNTGRSVRLTVRVSGGRPADTAATHGLREYGISVGYTPNRRAMVTISGVFTADGTTAARARYIAAIDALAGAAKTGLSITDWELVNESPTASSYNDKTITFSRDYQEIKFGQGGSGDDPVIFQQQLRVSFRRTSARNAPGGPYSFLGDNGYGTTAGTKGPAIPLFEVSASYSALIAFGTDALGKWQSLRSFVISQMRAAATSGGGSFALTGEDVGVLKDDNKLDATLSGVMTSGSAISREYSMEKHTESGIVRVPVWKGGPKTKYAYQGPSTERRTKTLVEETVSGGSGGGSSSGGSSESSGGGSNPWLPFGQQMSLGGSWVSLFGGVSDNPLGFGSESNDFGAGIFNGSTPGSSDSSSGYFYDAPVGGPNGDGTESESGGGGGGGGGGGDQAVAGVEDLVSDSIRTEKLDMGIDTPITITRTTRTQVTEIYMRLGPMAAYSAGSGIT